MCFSQAREAGRLLRAEGIEVDLCMTSYLRRAIRSACLVLSVLNQAWVPMEKNPLLNEQHPGVLSGLNKVDVAKEHGVEAVMKWRRSHDFAPPPLPLDGLRQICVSDTRYRDIEVPRTECLLDCKARVDRVWDETIAPALLEGALTHPFPPYVTPHFPYISQAFFFQVSELVQSILRKAGSNNAEALVQARVPHLRGFGVLAPAADGDDGDDGDDGVVVDVVFSQARP